MPRGYKTCSQCGSACGPRAFSCKECGADFETKKRFKKKKGWQDCDWTTLSEGNIIKVISGSGPFLSSDDGKIHMGVYGTFIVNNIKSDGLLAYPHKNKSHSGCCFIYMGDDKTSSKTDIQLRKHKIKLFIPKEQK